MSYRVNGPLALVLNNIADGLKKKKTEAIGKSILLDFNLTALFKYILVETVPLNNSVYPAVLTSLDKLFQD